MSHRITLLTGGSRSGKSRHALELAMTYERRAFIATAVAFDDEMRDRVGKHQDERGAAFATLEEPRDLAGALRRIPTGTDVAVIDCLTVWLGNLMHENATESGLIEAFLGALEDPPCDLLIVTNEVGMGIVPGNAMAREFRDLAGSLNQKVAALAGHVILMVSGLPLVVK